MFIFNKTKMVITKQEDVNSSEENDVFGEVSERGKRVGWGGRLFEFEWEGRWGGVGRGHLFEAGRLLSFSAFRMGAYSRWALIPGRALIRTNTVIIFK